MNGIGEFTTFTPTFTNLSVGNGTTEAYYTRVQDLVGIFVAITFGSTTSISGAVTLTLPFNRVTNATTRLPLGTAFFLDSGTVNIIGSIFPTDASVSQIQIRSNSVSGSNIAQISLSATSPFTWTTNDVLSFSFFYRKAA
jgi:hypothetical protein